MPVPKTRKVPQRMCVTCRQMFPKKDLFRIVVVDGHAELDLTGKKMGRGVYICKSAECIQNGLKEKRLRHHLKTDIPDSLIQEIELALQNEEEAAAKAKPNRVFRLDSEGKVQKVESQSEARDVD